MEVLAIIPARSNSKGIPGKNIIPINGKPLIAWNIEAARESDFIKRVVVSTDGEAIQKVAVQFGAEVVIRPDDISGDEASSESALLHVLEHMKQAENYMPDLVVFMQCTSPLTATEDIDNCIIKLIETKADSVTTVTPFHYFIWEEENGEAIGINHDKRFRPRRQDRKPQYLETGAVYVMRTSGFLECKHRFFGKTVVSVMPQERVVEIDEPADIVLAETMMRNLLKPEYCFPSNVTTLFLDFDGVLTDDTVITDQDGREAVVCSRGDGMGISMLKKTAIRVVVMSTEKNPVVTARCRKLGIECYQSLGHNKIETLRNFVLENQIDPATIIYMGNDVNDIECMEFAAFAAAPQNAQNAVKQISDLVTKSNGGHGAVRELCDLILKSRQ